MLLLDMRETSVGVSRSKLDAPALYDGARHIGFKYLYGLQDLWGED